MRQVTVNATEVTVNATEVNGGGGECDGGGSWQPKWNENQTVLATAIHISDKNTGPLEGATAGSWSLGIVEQSQSKGCC